MGSITVPNAFLNQGMHHDLRIFDCSQMEEPRSVRHVRITMHGTLHFTFDPMGGTIHWENQNSENGLNWISLTSMNPFMSKFANIIEHNDLGSLRVTTVSATCKSILEPSGMHS